MSMIGLPFFGSAKTNSDGERRSLAEFQQEFPNDESCAAFLIERRGLTALCALGAASAVQHC